MPAGIDMLSNPGGDSIVTPWEKMAKYDPEVLVIAPCGFTISRTAEEIHLLTDKKEWSQLTAVRNNAVFMADYDLFTQPSASTLTDGIELLAALFTSEHIYCSRTFATQIQTASSIITCLCVNMSKKPVHAARALF